jgi:SAM-dependent methyltransferase
LTSKGLLEPGRRVLDVGCYDGKFLARLPDGVLRMGVDIDSPAIERGRKAYESKHIEFIHGDFESFSYDRAAPDTITMFHVLEHLPRPVSVLRKLRSTTTLVVEVPILQNGQTNDINGFLSVQHMTHFSRASLQSALQLGGWRLLDRVEMPDYNGCRVLAMPSSEPITPSWDADDVGALHDYMASWYRALASVEKRLATFRDERQCVIWGAGAHTEFLDQTTSFFSANPARVYALVDSDPLKQGRSWRGIGISSPDTLKKIDWSATRLVVSSYGGQESIASAAVGLGVPEDRIIRLYDRVRVY